ncbi:glycosyl hydrolase [Niabella ginsengisoli]|uniref:DNA-binding protein n=1 Tax=Niabella ginsengisoli TaxID=522298 RepID=A0ABS9SHK4_9BACT|nr:glycosyl hydrolase [Niabella ginsengisoli]MCH5597848.1 DNA-binding protein [Niabella ginsengisoli]
MNLRLKLLVLAIACLFANSIGFGQNVKSVDLAEVFQSPPETAKPWVLWYWMHAAVSKEGITADLEGMKKVGIAGAYLVCIFDTVAKIPYDKPARQLTPEWWALVNHAMKECKRLDLKLAFHVSDGFALAGGPWIKPEQSMQKLVWTKTYVKAKGNDSIRLEQPHTNENFYKDIAVFAYPANSANAFSETVLIPAVTTSTGEKAPYLAFSGDDSKTFRSDVSCWIQYKYPKPFTLRSLKIHTNSKVYQSQRLIVMASNNGIVFDTVLRLQPPRHGWQDTDEDYTFSIPATTAKYFRFVYDKEGTEAGSEDLDGAKWKPSLKVKGIYLSDEPVINQIETKNGSIWRVAENTTTQMVNDSNAVQFKNIINLTNKMDKNGNLDWKPVSGDWVIVRMGHTSTGHTNATGGAAKGLECDKFNPDAIKLQFNNWFAKAFEKTDPGLAKEVIKIFYIDSWEAGSQNWSEKFAAEFKKRRGYDLMPYLLVMTGVPINDATTSEKILHDVRETIAELVNDIFYVTLRKLADEKGCTFTAENVAPTMVSDGLLHFKTVDYPTGEFWLNSPTHDKPNDMFDAISAAHIYGKNIVQAESFTSLKINWSEHPGNLKAIGDRNYAMGINRTIFHVNTQNPWMDRKPGMTLGSIGLFYQRDQTWYDQSKAWIDYITRVSALLQQGKPVADIAVFIGEEVPRRSVLPDRLVSALPGIFGKERLEAEKKRLENKGEPQRTIPDGVTHSANMADPEDWTDALRGYKYDCFNPDVLLKAKVVNGNVVFPSGASYRVLIFPGKLLMNPNAGLMSVNVAKKILQLKNAGATIIIDKREVSTIGLKQKDTELQNIWKELFSNNGKGRLIETPYKDATFDKIGVPRDLEVKSKDREIAWAHRKLNDGDLYFISNQSNKANYIDLSFRVAGYHPEIWDPVSGRIGVSNNWSIDNGRTQISLFLNTNESVFIVFRNKTEIESLTACNGLIVPYGSKPPGANLFINSNWQVQFDTAFGGLLEKVDFPKLTSWTEHKSDAVKYYSGTAVYTNHFSVDNIVKDKPVFLTIDSVFNIATVKVNGVDCGTIWTPPYQLDISKAIKTGANSIEIKVSNTWANRLIGDMALPENKRITWTTAPLNILEGKPLLKAGLVGGVKIQQ